MNVSESSARRGRKRAFRKNPSAPSHGGGMGPVNMGTMTVTGVDMNRDGIPDVLQQPQCGLGPQGGGCSCPVWSSSEHGHDYRDRC